MKECYALSPFFFLPNAITSINITHQQSSIILQVIHVHHKKAE